jgi:hypothetical protein
MLQSESRSAKSLCGTGYCCVEQDTSDVLKRMEVQGDNLSSVLQERNPNQASVSAAKFPEGR